VAVIYSSGLVRDQEQNAALVHPSVQALLLGSGYGPPQGLRKNNHACILGELRQVLQNQRHGDSPTLTQLVKGPEPIWTIAESGRPDVAGAFRFATLAPDRGCEKDQGKEYEGYELA